MCAEGRAIDATTLEANAAMKSIVRKVTPDEPGNAARLSW